MRPDQALALAEVENGQTSIQEWADLADELLAEGSVHLAKYAADMYEFLSS